MMSDSLVNGLPKRSRPARGPYPGHVADTSSPMFVRRERVLAFMVAAVIGLSIVAFIAALIAKTAGVDFSTGVWPTVLVLPLVGLPIGVILIIALLVVSSIRRVRESRDA